MFIGELLGIIILGIVVTVVMGAAAGYAWWILNTGMGPVLVGLFFVGLYVWGRKLSAKNDMSSDSGSDDESRVWE